MRMQANQKQLILLGAGRGTSELLSLVAHAKTVCGAELPWEVVGIIDDDPALAGTTVEGRPVLGVLQDAKRFPEACFLSCIANVRYPSIRLDIEERLGLPAHQWTRFVHPQATVVSNASIGRGTIVYPNVSVSAYARIGAQCVAYFGSVIHHDTIIGDGCCLCASVSIGGNVSVGNGCYLGIGSTIRDHVDIADGAVIGMGAVVVSDVRPGQTVVGVPAGPTDRRRLVPGVAV